VVENLQQFRKQFLGIRSNKLNSQIQINSSRKFQNNCFHRQKNPMNEA